jgi:hypothetical protein
MKRQERGSEYQSNRAWPAWVLAALSLACFAGLLFLEARGCGFLFQTSDPRPAIAYGVSMVPLNALAFTAMGALVAWLRPGNRYAWAMIAFGLFMNGIIVSNAYGTCGLQEGAALPFALSVFWLSETLAVLFPVFLMPLLLLYPDGHFFSSFWRRFFLVVSAAILLLALLGAFTPHTITDLLMTVEPMQNPYGLPALDLPLLHSALDAGVAIFSASALLAGLVALLLRYRQSRGAQRLQIKWFLFFIATVGVLFSVVEMVGVLVDPVIFDGWFYLIELALFWLGFPLVIGLAVLKYRLFNIDIIIRKTLQYGLLTAILIGVYFGAVLLTQAAFVALTGQESALAIVLSTLLIAALFNPLRRRLQAFIDRRFYRGEYDARQTLTRFARAARDEVETGNLAGLLLATVEETMRPETAVLWLNEGTRDLKSGTENWQLGAGK